MNVKHNIINTPEGFEYHIDKRCPRAAFSDNQTDVYLTSFTTPFVMTFAETDEKYVNSEALTADGMGRATVTSPNVKPTTVMGIDAGSLVFYFLDDSADAYRAFIDLLDVLGVDASVSNNDLMVGENKLIGVASAEGGYAAAGQLDLMGIDIERYTDLPAKKFEDKTSDSMSERISAINQHTSTDILIEDVISALESVTLHHP